MGMSPLENARNPSDGELVSKVVDGETGLFDLLVARYQKLVARVAWHMLHNLADVEDAVQEAFLNAFTGLAGIREAESFKSWLVQIALNVCRARMKGWCRQPAAVALESLERQSAEHRADSHVRSEELSAFVAEAVEKLPETYREAVVLHYNGELSHGEISKILGCPEETVRWRVFQARKMLRKMLERLL